MILLNWKKKIVNHCFSYTNSSLKDYFFDFVMSMNGFDLPDYKREKVKKLVNKIQEIRRNEHKYPIWAENELRKFFD